MKLLDILKHSKELFWSYLVASNPAQVVSKHLHPITFYRACTLKLLVNHTCLYQCHIWRGLYASQKKVPLSGPNWPIEIEIKANVALPEPEIEYSTENYNHHLLIGMWVISKWILKNWIYCWTIIVSSSVWYIQWAMIYGLSTTVKTDYKFSIGCSSAATLPATRP